MKFLIAIIFVFSALNVYADDAEFECKGKNLSIKVMSVYGTNFHQYLLIESKSIFNNTTLKVPLQFNVSLDPHWTTPPMTISDDAREEKATLAVGKGGHYLKMLAPTKELGNDNNTESRPATFNSPAFKNGKTIELSCTQLIFG